MYQDNYCKDDVIKTMSVITLYGVIIFNPDVCISQITLVKKCYASSLVVEKSGFHLYSKTCNIILSMTPYWYLEPDFLQQ